MRLRDLNVTSRMGRKAQEITGTPIRETKSHDNINDSPSPGATIRLKPGSAIYWLTVVSKNGKDQSFRRVGLPKITRNSLDKLYSHCQSELKPSLDQHDITPSETVKSLDCISSGGTVQLHIIFIHEVCEALNTTYIFPILVNRELWSLTITPDHLMESKICLCWYSGPFASRCWDSLSSDSRSWPTQWLFHGWRTCQGWTRIWLNTWSMSVSF